MVSLPGGSVEETQARTHTPTPIRGGIEGGGVGVSTRGVGRADTSEDTHPSTKEWNRKAYGSYLNPGGSVGDTSENTLVQHQKGGIQKRDVVISAWGVVG